MVNGNEAITRADVEKLEKTLADIEVIQKERSVAEAKNGKELVDKVEKNHQAATDLMNTLKVVEQKQANYEKALARQTASLGADADGIDYKHFGDIICNNINNAPRDFTYNAEVAATHKKAFDIYMKYGMKGIMYGNHGLEAEEVKFVNSIISEQGGFITPPAEFSRYIIPKRFDNYSLMEHVNKITIGTDSYKEYLDQGDYEDAEWVTQFSNAPSDVQDNQFRQLAWYVHTLVYGKSFARDAMEDMFIDTGYFLEKMREGSNRKIAKLLWNGTGINEMRGLLTYPDGTGVVGEVEQIESTESLSVTWDDFLYKMPTALKDYYQDKASYIMPRRTFYSLLLQKSSTGDYSIRNMVNFFSKEGISLSLLGFPTSFDVGLQAYGTAGNLAVAFGDFSEAYNFINRVGLSYIRNETDPIKVTMYQRERMGGGLRVGEAVKLLKIKA